MSLFFKNYINDAKIHTFLKKWVENVGKGSIYISYDSTNMNCEANGVDIAEYGAAKDYETKKQINISYVFDQKNGIPLFYELYSGSVTDIVEIKKLIDKCKSIGLKDVVFVLDRGYYSQSNVEKILKCSNGFVMMAKTSVNTIKEAIDLARDDVESPMNYIPSEKIYGKRVEKLLFKQDLKGQERYFYVFKNLNVSDYKHEILVKYQNMYNEIEALIDKVIIFCTNWGCGQKVGH